jgi:hypothetical protein
MAANRKHVEDLDIFALMAKALSLQPLGHYALEAGERSPSPPAKAASPHRRRGLLERLDHWFWEREQREVEAHLAKSTDIYDLEARIRDLERGVLYRYY